MHKLDKQCGVCNSYTWCGRQCAFAPSQNVRKPDEPRLTTKRSGPKVVERYPWDDEEPEVPKMKKDKKAKQKKPDTIRFPQEVKEFFQKDGPGWQKRINEALLEYVRSRQ